MTATPTPRHIPHHTHPDRSHAGSSKEEIQNEPDWVHTHNHRIGFRDKDDRHPGLTHVGDECHTEKQRQFLDQAKKEAAELRRQITNKELINIREFMEKQEVRTSIASVDFFPFTLPETDHSPGLSLEVS